MTRKLAAPAAPDPTAVHRHPVRVYYEDTDLAGIVYHANYLRFIERGRTEALRAAGLDQGRLKAEAGLVFVVHRIEADFLVPARFDDALVVETCVTEKKRASLTMMQTVMREASALFRARVRLACMDAEGRPVRLPAEMEEALARLGIGP
ncbi:MAG: tol-pal system-associated acyl-CoA thioesterase [Pseudomonadota bacterium]